MPDHQDVDATLTLDAVDPVFAEVMTALYGDAVDLREAYDISKLDGADVHVNGGLKAKKRREKRQAQVGLASNAVGLAAGMTALGAAARDERLLGGGKVARSLHRTADKLPKISPRTGRRGAAVALGALGLQALNTGGDVVANRVLAREAKKDIKKSVDEIIAARREGRISTEQAIELADQLVAKAGKHAMSRRALVARAEVAEEALRSAPKARNLLLGTAAAAGGTAGYVAGRRHGKKAVKPLVPSGTDAPQGKHRSGYVEKADTVDYGFTGEIKKFDEDKRLAFGWCSVSEIDGKPVTDLQGDYAPIDEIEKTAYAYVVKSRVGGDMHQRREDGSALHTSDLVESFVVTPEKLVGMGLAEEVAKSVPVGWWVGFRVNDDEQWAMVKDGRRTGFSVHGKGRRVQKALEA